MLQKNREMDEEIWVLFATHGCPKQFYIIQKNTPQTHIKRAKVTLSRVA
jgi:hypothetical protein